MSDGDAEPDEEAGPDPESGSDPPDGRGSEGRATRREAPDRTPRGRAATGENDRDPEPAAGNGAEANRAGTDPPGRDAEPAATTGDHSTEGSEVTPEEIDVDELTGPVRRLDPRVRYVWVLGSVVGALVLGGIAGVVGFVAFDRPLLGPAVFLFLLGLGAVLAVLRYRSWSYEVREDSLYLERGVLTHTRTVVPYVRIQHVDASRGPVERALGLATAVVYTAGSRGADVSIPGLTTDRADDLQERLKRLAIAAEGEDAV